MALIQRYTLMAIMQTVVIMVRQGMTPMQAVQAASSVAAKFIGWEDKVGSIKAGLYADIIAVKNNPLEDITALQNVSVVIKEGKVLKLPLSIKD